MPLPTRLSTVRMWFRRSKRLCPQENGEHSWWREREGSAYFLSNEMFKTYLPRMSLFSAKHIIIFECVESLLFFFFFCCVVCTDGDVRECFLRGSSPENENETQDVCQREGLLLWRRSVFRFLSNPILYFVFVTKDADRILRSLVFVVSYG